MAGHSWELKGSELESMINNLQAGNDRFFSQLQEEADLTMSLTFKGIQQLYGERCAHIAIAINGKGDVEGIPLTARGSGVFVRSLESGLVLQHKINLRLSASGTKTERGVRGTLRMSANVNKDTTVAVTKPEVQPGQVNPEPEESAEPREPAFVKEGLVAYYPFNGNANDESGNGNNGEVKGATLVKDRHGEGGKAYAFDGVDDLISVPHADSLNTPDGLSVSLWVKAEKKHTGQIISKGNGGQENYDYAMVVAADGKIVYGWRTVPSKHIGTGTIKGIAVGDWHYVTVVHISGSMPILYLNGVAQSVSIYRDQSSVRALWKSPIHMGVDPQPRGFSRYLNGSVDDIRIYNRALPEEQVKALYEFEKPKE